MGDRYWKRAGGLRPRHMEMRREGQVEVRTVVRGTCWEWRRLMTKGVPLPGWGLVLPKDPWLRIKCRLRMGDYKERTLLSTQPQTAASPKKSGDQIRSLYGLSVCVSLKFMSDGMV